jgi:ribonuclease HI
LIGIEDDHLSILTIGRHFRDKPGEPGIWAAELLWVEEGRPCFDQVKGYANGSNNVALEVRAVLEGLRRAKEIRLPVIMRSVNQTIVDTIPLWVSGWKEKGWKKKKGEIASLEQWREIDVICQELEVQWIKRPKEKIDQIDDYERLWAELEERENEHLMKRAMARDPYG